MSQTAAPQAAPSPATPAAPAAAAAPATPGKAEQQHVDTPALLNRWQLIGMVATVLFGIVSALVQLGGWQADGRAADDTEQVVRVQEVQSSLLRADALATNGFLVGGLEDPDQRQQYDAALERVLTLITDAADAQPADREALAALNVEVANYATAVAQARDYNRLRFPVGAEYMNGASTDLRADAQPILEALVDANTDRAEDAMGGQHPFWLFLLGLLTVLVLFWVNRNLALHFRRRINKGVAVAAIIVAAVTLVSAAAAFVRDGSNDSLLEDEFATAVAEANARTAANDAKANESLRLIKRGSGEANEEDWEASAEVVAESASRETSGLWSSYVQEHQAIVKLDRAGSWDEAVRRATSADGSTAALEAFDETSEDIVKANGEEATDDLRSGRGLALVLALLTLALGVVAALAVARGIGERRREFA